MASYPTRHHMRGDQVARKCATTLKIGYADRAAALDACEATMRAGRVEPGCHVMPYRCDDCGEWHTRNQRIVFTEAPTNVAMRDYRRRRKGDPR
jgi:hypothetical protein